MAQKLKVTLVRSPIDRTQKQKDTVRGLGLRRLNSSRILEDTPGLDLPSVTFSGPGTFVVHGEDPQAATPETQNPAGVMASRIMIKKNRPISSRTAIDNRMLCFFVIFSECLSWLQSKHGLVPDFLLQMK